LSLHRDAFSLCVELPDDGFSLRPKHVASNKLVKRSLVVTNGLYRGADKSLARPGRKQATATEDFDFHMSNL
jgi:hypothetical protein